MVMDRPRCRVFVLAENEARVDFLVSLMTPSKVHPDTSSLDAVFFALETSGSAG